MVSRHDCSTDGDNNAEELPALNIEIDRLETKIELIDMTIEELRNENIHSFSIYMMLRKHKKFDIK